MSLGKRTFRARTFRGDNYRSATLAGTSAAPNTVFGEAVSFTAERSRGLTAYRERGVTAERKRGLSGDRTR